MAGAAIRLLTVTSGRTFKWDTSLSRGPIVEQAINSIDIMRYFGGEIAEEPVSALEIGPELPLFDMPPAPYAEHTVWPAKCALLQLYRVCLNILILIL